MTSTTSTPATTSTSTTAARRRAAVRVEQVQGPVWWRYICRWIFEHHRHHAPPQGWRYGLVAWRGSLIVGAATIGRAVARGLNGTAEVTRLVTWGPSTARHGAASALLRRAAELEPRVVTYTLATESGVSLLAAGWVPVARVRGRRWSTPSRERAPRLVESIDKIRWMPSATCAAAADATAKRAVG